MQNKINILFILSFILFLAACGSKQIQKPDFTAKKGDLIPLKNSTFTKTDFLR